MALSDIVEKNKQWMDESACVGRPEPFDNYDQGGVAAHEADMMCLTCPVIKECFSTGAGGKEYGQWGGVYWNGNGEPDLKANSHKSQEYLDEIERMVK